MILRMFAGVLPLAAVLALAGAEVQGMVPRAEGLAAALDSMSACADRRHRDAAAVADGFEPPPVSAAPKVASVPVPAGATVARVEPAAPDHCTGGTHTVVTFSDGSTVSFPGVGVLAAVDGAVARFVVS